MDWKISSLIEVHFYVHKENCHFITFARPTRTVLELTLFVAERHKLESKDIDVAILRNQTFVAVDKKTNVRELKLLGSASEKEPLVFIHTRAALPLSTMQESIKKMTCNKYVPFNPDILLPSDIRLEDPICRLHVFETPDPR